MECIDRSQISLRPHQINVVRFLAKESTRGLLAVHSVGSGKTLTAVAASQCFLDQHPRSKVIIVTPSSLVENIRKEIRGYGADPEDPRYHFYTIAGFTAAIRAGTAVSCRGSMLIIDEAHNLRTPVSLRPEEKDDVVRGEGIYAHHLLECAKHARKILLLTATPFINEKEEIINLMAMIDGIDPITLGQFRRLTNYEKYFRCKVSVFEPTMEARALEYPSVKNQDIVMAMTPSYLKKYKEVEDLCKISDSVRVFYNGLRKGANALEGDRSPKIDWVMRHLSESKEGERHVVFSHFIASGISLLMDRLKRDDISFAHITGEVSLERRARAVQRYNEGLLKVLVISKAGGEGLDLKNTTSIIILEPAWNESTHRQVIGRAVRFQSHAALPRAKQVVSVYRLYLIKPEERDIVKKAFTQLWLENKENMNADLSIDLYLRNRAYQKQKELDEFMENLRRGSIERRVC